MSETNIFFFRVHIDKDSFFRYNSSMSKKKVGRPKKKVEKVMVEDMIDEGGNPVSLNPNSKYSVAQTFKSAVENPQSVHNATRGMYAGITNPEEYVHFYKKVVATEKKGRPWTYPNADVLQKKVSEYFEFCIDRRIAVTVAGLSAWLGISVATLRNWKINSDTMPFYEVVEPAIAFIHAMTEQGAVDGNVPAQVFMFISKNYYGLKDQMEYSVTPKEKIDSLEQDDIVKQLPDVDK